QSLTPCHSHSATPCSLSPSSPPPSGDGCREGCPLALAAYYITASPSSPGPSPSSSSFPPTPPPPSSPPHRAHTLRALPCRGETYARRRRRGARQPHHGHHQLNCSCATRGCRRGTGGCSSPTRSIWDGERETLASAAEQYGFSLLAQMDLLRRYIHNHGMDGISEKGFCAIPVKQSLCSVGTLLRFCELSCFY
ncbi:unnamed protein product, partial [Urochloa humidicola]